MFDKLIESTKEKNGRATRRFFAATSAIYALVLFAFGVATVVTFSPVLAEEYGLLTMLPPPVPYDAPPPQATYTLKDTAAIPQIFTPPERTIEIPSVSETMKYQPRGPIIDRAVPGGMSGMGNGVDVRLPGGREDGTPVPPPPEIKIRPTPPPPTPTLEAKPEGPRKVSEGVLQGSAVRKIKPDYPVIARQARTQGLVQVQVTISESGQVIEVAVLGGHPLLRAAAEAAARQWVFTPTKLSGVPVKVQGVLSFNFTLN